MKTVDELMALADDLAQAHYNLGSCPEPYDSELCDEARAALLTALQEALREPYDQQALELCEACGWKTLIPGDSCLNCARSIDTSQEPVEKSGENVQVQPIVQPLKDYQIVAFGHRIASTYAHRSDPTRHSYGFLNHTLIDFARAIEQAHGIGEVGINGLTEAETSASMSVAGLSKPTGDEAIDLLIEAVEDLMAWQVKNVKVWNNSAYDLVSTRLKRYRAQLKGDV